MISEDLVPYGLRSTFVNLSPSIGEPKPLTLDQLELRHLDFNEYYGLRDLTAKSIFELAERLADDDDLHQDFLVRKMGFDPSKSEEVTSALQILSGKEIITQISDDKENGSFKNYSMWP